MFIKIIILTNLKCSLFYTVTSTKNRGHLPYTMDIFFVSKSNHAHMSYGTCGCNAKPKFTVSPKLPPLLIHFHSQTVPNSRCISTLRLFYL